MTNAAQTLTQSIDQIISNQPHPTPTAPPAELDCPLTIVESASAPNQSLSEHHSASMRGPSRTNSGYLESSANHHTSDDASANGADTDLSLDKIPTAIAVPIEEGDHPLNEAIGGGNGNESGDESEHTIVVDGMAVVEVSEADNDSVSSSSTTPSSPPASPTSPSSPTSPASPARRADQLQPTAEPTQPRATFFQSMCKGTRSLCKGIQDAIMGVINYVGAYLLDLMDGLETTFSLASDVYSGVQEKIQHRMEFIAPIFNYSSAIFAGLLSGTATFALGTLFTIVDAMISIPLGRFDSLCEDIPSTFTATYAVGTSVGEGTFEVMKAVNQASATVVSHGLAAACGLLVVAVGVSASILLPVGTAAHSCMRGSGGD